MIVNLVIAIADYSTGLTFARCSYVAGKRLDIRMLLLARMMEQLYACKDIGSTLPTETIPASVTSPLYRNLRGKKRVFYSITKMPRNVVKTPY